MADIQAKIDELEAEMARTQKNKATNYHLGTLKAKIAKVGACMSFRPFLDYGKFLTR